MPRLLDGDEIGRQLDDLPGWVYLRRSLRASYRAPSSSAAASLVAAVAEVAEEMDHHPDMDLRWRTVAFTCSTDTAGGVTQLDVELAHRIAEEAERVRAGLVVLADAQGNALCVCADDSTEAGE